MPLVDLETLTWLTVVSYLAAVITVVQFSFNIIKGNYQRNWKYLAFGVAAFVFLAVASAIGTYFTQTREIIGNTIYFVALIYMGISAASYLGSSLVLWTGKFDAFHYIVFYIVTAVTFCYSLFLMKIVGQKYILAASYFAVVVLFHILTIAERTVFKFSGYPFKDAIDSLRDKLAERSSAKLEATMGPGLNTVGETRKRPTEEVEPGRPTGRSRFEEASQESRAEPTEVPADDDQSRELLRSFYNPPNKTTTTEQRSVRTSATPTSPTSIFWGRKFGEYPAIALNMVFWLFGAALWAFLGAFQFGQIESQERPSWVGESSVESPEEGDLPLTLSPEEEDDDDDGSSDGDSPGPSTDYSGGANP